MIQLDYDYHFDKFHPDSDKIFRMEMFTPQTSRIPMTSRPLAERFFESSPHIVAGAITNQSMSGGGSEIFFSVENKDGERNYFKEKALTVTPTFFDVFTFDFIEGSTDGHLLPGNVFIPLSLSRKLFGNDPAVDKQVIINGIPQTVLAVYRDFPSNSTIGNYMYSFMDKDEGKDNWMGFMYNAYIRVNEAINAPQLIENFVRNFDFRLIFGQDFNLEAAEAGGFSFSLYLTALPDVHFTSNIKYDFVPKTSRQTLLILFTVAIMIVVIAGINFTNFSAALTPMRLKSLNTQLVLGSRRKSLRLSLVFEAVFIGFLSYLVALGLILIFQDTPLAQLVNADLSLAAHPFIIFGTALIAAPVGFLVSVYPSRYMTSFKPALVMKGNFGLSQKGKKIRYTLIGIQFAASFALIVGASFMYLQNRFMQNSNLGYDKNALITVDIGRINQNRDAFTNQIKAYSGVEDVTYSLMLLSSSDAYIMAAHQYRGEYNFITFQYLPVHHSFLQMMDVEITEGRDFRQTDANTEHGVGIFNETARKQYNLELNTFLEGFGGGGEIIGFMPDVKYASCRMAVEPMAFYLPGTVNSWMGTNNAYIRLKEGANLRAAMSHIHATLAAFDPNYTFNVRFFDEVLHRL
jgi:putative ABC transport system permease protein